MKTTFIYSLSDPRTNQIRYVGKTNNPKERLVNHCNPARYRPTYKFNWIKELRGLGLKPILEVIDEVPLDDWKFWEKFWIQLVKSWGFLLVNHTNGGDGLTFGNQTSFKKGSKPWNTGTAYMKECEVCGNKFKVYPSQSKKRFSCSHTCGAVLKKERTKVTQFKKEQIPWNKGLNYKIKK